jgi:hypothetical protein
MKVSPEALKNLLNQCSFSDNGDRYERKYGKYLKENFPNCEQFWRVFVVPFTQRINGYPDKIVSSINVRLSIKPEIEDIANMHYSMFLNLAFAHLHLETKMDSSVENIYVHLGSACDLAEAVLENWYLMLLQCQDKKTALLQELTRDQFIAIAGQWYDERYTTLYGYYKEKGRMPPVELPSIDGLITEYLGKETGDREDYVRCSQNIRTLRNVVVHNVKIARIIDSKGRALIPKSKVISKYRSWRKVQATSTNSNIIERDFAEEFEQAREDLLNLEKTINGMWNKLINDFEEEFYSSERDKLRNWYDIEFTTGRATLLDTKADQQHPLTPPASGTYPPQYYGGTIEIYHKRSDDTDS